MNTTLLRMPIAVGLLALQSALWAQPNRTASPRDTPAAQLAMPGAPVVPAIHPDIRPNANGVLQYTTRSGEVFVAEEIPPVFTLRQARHSHTGSRKGLAFDFGDTALGGTVFYGLIDPRQLVDLPMFYKKGATISKGLAEIDMATLQGSFDFTGWQASGRARLAYRIVRADGLQLYEGKTTLRNTANGFVVDTCVVEGPFLQNLLPGGATVYFRTNFATRPRLQVLSVGIATTGQPAYAQVGQALVGTADTTVHALAISGLTTRPDAGSYAYVLQVGAVADTFRLAVPPQPGARKPFTFAMCADSRFNAGGGERRVLNVNAYMLRRIFALAKHRGAAFLQFSGDLINGYITSAEETRLEYGNWKRAVEPWASELPFFACFGNHEVLTRTFRGPGNMRLMVARFPYSEGGEALFAQEMCNPLNGPSTEDGTALDPNPRQTDFPPYAETAFHYRYDNVAIINLNSNYLYSPTLDVHPDIGGNLHGYIMDAQLGWLRSTLQQYEADASIDHVFVTLHTPVFPNGGHLTDDMWYNGNNAPRPVVQGQAAKQGIIERRDSLLAICINETQKVRGILSGDEHNYHRTWISDATPRYPEGWAGKRVALRRPFWHITNGAAGSPYYGPELAPWTPYVRFFTTQNTLLLFHVNGPRIEVEAQNPESLAPIDSFVLVE